MGTGLWGVCLKKCFYSRQWKYISTFSVTSIPALGPPSFISSVSQGFYQLGSWDRDLKFITVLHLVTQINMHWILLLLHLFHVAYTGKTCLFNNYWLPDYDAVYSRRKVPKFWRNQLPPSSLFRPEDRNSRFPQSICRLLLEYTASYTKSSSHESLESQIRALVIFIVIPCNRPGYINY